MENNLKGLIFNIQKFSLDDGPGIRTTVFMKGCPLACQWCSNPEGISPAPQIMISDRKCIVCKKCEETCPIKAISFDKGYREIDWKTCNNCLECAAACPSKSIEQVGEYKTVDEVFKVVAHDESFYRNSGGGVTVSGGEAMLQWEFVLALFKKCRTAGYHTTLDTTAYCRWEHLRKVLEYTDLVLFDAKHMDPVMHKEKTGVTNELILENLEKTARKNKIRKNKIWIRLPFIPGYNTSSTNLEKTAELAEKVNAEKVSILPYHEWGRQKYPRLGRIYPLEEGTPIKRDDQIVEKTKKIFESKGLHIDVGK